MPLVFYKAEAADRGKVTFVHYNPERLSAQERALGISVDAVPEFDRLSGKSAVLYINPQTGDLWHEYVDIPTTQWVQRNEMIALMEGMPGSGVATESTLVEAVESLEGVEAKVATAGKQDAAKAVLDAIKTSAAAAATEATLAAIQTALTDGTLKAQLSGSLVESELNAKTGLVIAAGATATAIFARSIRGRRCTFVAEHADGSPSSMAVGYRLWTQANKALAGADTMAPDVNSEATSITFDVTAPKAYFRVKNGATAEKTFDCHLYFWSN